MDNSINRIKILKLPMKGSKKRSARLSSGKNASLITFDRTFANGHVLIEGVLGWLKPAHSSLAKASR